MKCLYGGRKRGINTCTHALEVLPDVRHDYGTFRNEVAIVHIILLDTVRSTERGRRAPADDLLHRRGEVWELVAVCECGQSVGSYNGIELGLDFPLDFGVHGHGEEERRHCRDGLFREKGKRMQFRGRMSEGFSQCRHHQSRGWMPPT